MITISKAIEDIIIDTPYLEEGLSKGIINLSALARDIRPQIKKRLYKKEVSEAALIMALKRFQPKVKKHTSIPRLLSEMNDITVRSNLVEITMINSPEVDHIRRELMKAISFEKGAFFNIIQGVKGSTIIFSKTLESVVNKHLLGKNVSKLTNISSITIALPPINHTTPGVYYTLLKALAWQNINLIEVVSNSDELTLLFDDRDVDRAFSLIKELTK